MSKDSDTQTEQRQLWQMAVEAWQTGGLSVRQFCKQEVGRNDAAFSINLKHNTFVVNLNLVIPVYKNPIHPVKPKMEAAACF